MDGHDILVYLAMNHHGDWDEMVKAVRAHESFDSKSAEAQVKALSCKAVTLVDADYPQMLKNAPKPPLVLFYEGDISLIDNPTKCISYIGSRNASDYGLAMSKAICEPLAKEGFVIVSGLAKGIDAESARASLPYKRTVAVLGNGLDYYYPSENSSLQREIKEKGLLLSEYPLGEGPKPENFPARNRIIAALSQLVIVGEASSRSGTLITVGYALSMGKEVACVPFRANEGSACNALIKDGAAMVEKANDVYDLLNYIPKEKPLSK